MDASSEPTRSPAAPLPEGYRYRRARRSDLAAVARMMRAEEIALIGESDVTEGELLADWQLPRLSLERDAWLIETPGGRTAGYAWVWDEKPHAELFADFNVDPDDPHRRVVSTHLLAQIEARSREHHTEAGGARVLLGIPAREGHGEKLDLLAEHGFTETRRLHRMRIDLREGSVPPAWPDGIEVREFRRGRDEGAVHQALQEAFAEHFRFVPLGLDEWERHVFAHTGLDTRLWILAWDGAEVAGACLAFDNPDRGYVDDLSVREPWRGRGLGLALLLEAFARLEARGQTEVVLGVDSQNASGAVALYERAGMRVDSVRLFMEKEVDPGEDTGGLP
jgi:mycothiol synthase